MYLFNFLYSYTGKGLFGVTSGNRGDFFITDVPLCGVTSGDACVSQQRCNKFNPGIQFDEEFFTVTMGKHLYGCIFGWMKVYLD